MIRLLRTIPRAIWLYRHAWRPPYHSRLSHALWSWHKAHRDITQPDDFPF